MARRGLWVIGGMAVGVGALVLRPDTRTWLRRRLGLEAEDRRWFEDENGEPAEHEGDEPLDTREARFSLRARLAEEGIGEQTPAAAEEAVAEEAPLAAPPPPPPPPVAPVAPISYAPPVAPPAVTPLPDPEPLREPEPEPEPEPAAALPEPPAPAPAPTWTPPPAPPPPAPVAPAPEPVVESPEPEYLSYEAVPAVRPETEAPKTPGEDTNEIEPLPPVSSWEPPPAPPPAAPWQPPAAATPPPPPPPIELRPSTPPPAPAPRPFSSEGASFRSAIDAARERVHGSAREATPEDGEAGESDDERS